MKRYLIGLIFLVSCDCQFEATGIVIDGSTGLPLNEVAIGKTDTTDLNNPFNRKEYTDEKGRFEFYGIAGRCNNISLYFSKSGYQMEKIEFDNYLNDTIYLKKK